MVAAVVFEDEADGAVAKGADAVVENYGMCAA